MTGSTPSELANWAQYAPSTMNVGWATLGISSNPNVIVSPRLATRVETAQQKSGNDGVRREFDDHPHRPLGVTGAGPKRVVRSTPLRH